MIRKYATLESSSTSIMIRKYVTLESSHYFCGSSDASRRNSNRLIFFMTKVQSDDLNVCN